MSESKPDVDAEIASGLAARSADGSAAGDGAALHTGLSESNDDDLELNPDATADAIVPETRGGAPGRGAIGDLPGGGGAAPDARRRGPKGGSPGGGSEASAFVGGAVAFAGEAGASTGEAGAFVGEAGAFAGEAGAFAGEAGACVREAGAFAGEAGAFAGEAGAFARGPSAAIGPGAWTLARGPSCDPWPVAPVAPPPRIGGMDARPSAAAGASPNDPPPRGSAAACGDLGGASGGRRAADAMLGEPFCYICLFVYCCLLVAIIVCLMLSRFRHAGGAFARGRPLLGGSRRRPGPRLGPRPRFYVVGF